MYCLNTTLMTYWASCWMENINRDTSYIIILILCHVKDTLGSTQAAVRWMKSVIHLSHDATQLNPGMAFKHYNEYR